MRVHGFLEMWGLINYQVGKDRKALQMGPSATNAYNILVDMPLGIQPLPPQKPQSEKETPGMVHTNIHHMVLTISYSESSYSHTIQHNN